MKIDYGQPIPDEQWPDNDESLSVVHLHTVLNVRLASGFTSHLTLPAKLRKSDCDKIIAALTRWRDVFVAE